jgi:rubrerythrin
MDQAYCDALRFALEFEKKGEKFYRQSVDRAINDQAKKTLQFLADEEIKHSQKIEEFNQALLNNHSFDIEKECSSELSERLHSFIDQYVKNKTKEIGELSTDLEIYQSAMDMEKYGHDMYKSALKSSSETKIKKFFQFLVDEETLHYQLLAASKKYLEDPSYYFEESGGWIFS